MNEREKFLKALEANEDDMPVRLAFADWLDEQGEHEEADRHRKWTASNAWIIFFCEENWPGEFNDGESFNFTEIMEKALQVAVDVEEKGEGYWSCGSNMDLSYSEQWTEFWKCWSIVSGIPLPPEFRSKVRYGCAC